MKYTTVIMLTALIGMVSVDAGYAAPVNPVKKSISHHSHSTTGIGGAARTFGTINGTTFAPKH